MGKFRHRNCVMKFFINLGLIKNMTIKDEKKTILEELITFLIRYIKKKFSF